MTQLVLSENRRYVLAALSVAMFVCAAASAQTPHVRLESGSAHASKIEALRDDKKISLQFRSILLQTDFPGAKSVESAVQMIYDPESKLFEWQSSPAYHGYDAELEAKQFATGSIVYLAPHRLVVFSRSMFGSQAVVQESTEQYESMDQGQHSVMRFFEERSTAAADTAWNVRFKTVDIMKDIPRSLMDQCYYAITIPPRIEELRRNEKQWILKITGPTGNSAEISLDDAFKVVATKLLPRPAVIVENSASVPSVHAVRGGISSQLEARELLLSIADGCNMPSYSRVLVVYDPATKLFLWFSEEPPPDFFTKHHPFPDEIAMQFFQNSIFVITEDKIVAFSTDTAIVHQSSARFASLEEAQQSIMSQIVKPASAPAYGEKQVPLASLLIPLQYQSLNRAPPSWRSVTYEGGRWRLQLEFSVDPLKHATLFLDDSFNPVKADLTYATPPVRSRDPADWPLLLAMRNLKADQLAPPPPSELKITDKSSSIHALKNGSPVEVQARLIGVHRFGKMLAVYDPASRLFWCIYGYEANGTGGSIGYYSSQFEKGNSWLVITDEKILGFDAADGGGSAGVQESTLRYASFSEGLNYALTAVWRNPEMIRDGHVYLNLLLPSGFLEPRTAHDAAPRYLRISESHHNWQLVLEAASGQQAVVTLDEKYEPVRASITYVAPAQTVSNYR